MAPVRLVEFGEREIEVRMVETAAAAVALAACCGTAWAAPVLGLVGDKTLVLFDTADPAVVRTVTPAGVDRLVGIDYRPANGTLVGVTPDGTVVSIDPDSGATVVLSKMKIPLKVGSAPVVVDFNPMADRLRYMIGTTNRRVNVYTGDVTVDGSLAFQDGDMHKGEKPNIVAAAYINSYGKPQKTAMYDLDATIGALIRQTSPNDGTLAAVGKLGAVKAGGTYAFDVQTTGDGVNTAWLVSDGGLFTVDLETGKATAVGKVTGAGGAIRDIAVLPAK